MTRLLIVFALGWFANVAVRVARGFIFARREAKRRGVTVRVYYRDMRRFIEESERLVAERRARLAPAWRGEIA